MWVSICVGKNISLIVCCVYVPPHASVDNLRTHLNRAAEFVTSESNDYFLVIGDYNIPPISWSDDFEEKCFTAPEVPDCFGENVVGSYKALQLNRHGDVCIKNG